MKVKELYKKYKDYSIMLFGLPLEKPSTPFSCLPMNMKVLNEYVVKDIKIKDQELTTMDFDMSLKYKGSTKYKGTVYAYVVKEV